MKRTLRSIAVAALAVATTSFGMAAASASTAAPAVPARQCSFGSTLRTLFAESMKLQFINSNCAGERARLVCQYDERGVVTSVPRDGNTVGGSATSTAQCTVITGATREGYNWFGYQLKQTNGTWATFRL